MSGDMNGERKLAAFRKGQTEIPDSYWLWPLYGAGIENLGRDGEPIEVPMQDMGPDELLIRHDAVGLCFSDVKVIKAGPEHPRIYGRDMEKEPVVLGHEVALTVLRVGENLRDQYKPGDRFIMQADIYYQGVGMAYGYEIQGGLSQFNVIGKEILEGDDGCYILPVHPETGYAQAALTEPWACVTASYDVVYRTGWKPEGVVLIAKGPAAEGDYSLGTPYGGGQPPAKVITMGVDGALAAELRQRSEADGFALVALAAPSEETLEKALDEAGDGFDDVVFLGADAALYELLEPKTAVGATLNLVGAEGLTEAAQVDVGRIHYDGLMLVGTTSSDLSQAYAPVRTELVPDGAAVFVGAAGPMGQMHVQRALESEEPPKLLVATDLLADRLGVIEEKFAELIESKRDQVELLLKVPGDTPPDAFNAELVQLTGGKGFDDVTVLAPSARVVAGAVDLLADGGAMNIFAGLTRGTRAPIDLNAVVERGIRFRGTSGSGIDDLRSMLAYTESQRLNTNLSVDCVTGFRAAREGIDGVMHQRFEGKCVVYPMIMDFPLTTLAELKDALPKVYAKLGPNETWTVEAEEEFLKELLP
ncbi:MAG: alcohol dehydrogenase catalytic domain-containing protein [Anaerolineae bacterium]